MINSKQKSSNVDIFSDYFIENNYFTTNQSEHGHYHKTHQRKSSQVSTRSCKSKLRNLSSIDKNHSNIKLTTHTIQSRKNVTLKTTKTDEKKSFLKKEFSLDRMKVQPIKYKNPESTRRKEKLKITHSDDRKEKMKLIENLTKRYIKHSKQEKLMHNHFNKKEEKLLKTDKSTSHSSFLNKFEQLEEKVKTEKKKNLEEEQILRGSKIQERKFELIFNRCETVMGKYYEKIVALKRENEVLKKENVKLKMERGLV